MLSYLPVRIFKDILLMSLIFSKGLIMMVQEMNFKCAGDGFDAIPEAVISAAGVSLPNAHSE